MTSIQYKSPRLMIVAHDDLKGNRYIELHAHNGMRHAFKQSVSEEQAAEAIAYDRIVGDLGAA